MTGLASLSTGGPGCVPLTRDWVEAAADLAVTASGGHRTGTACPPKKAVRDRAVRLIAIHNRHRAGLPIAPPSIAPKGLEPKRLRAREACRFDLLLVRSIIASRYCHESSRTTPVRKTVSPRVGSSLFVGVPHFLTASRGGFAEECARVRCRCSSL